MDLAAALPAIEAWGLWAYAALFAVSLFESAPLLGTAIPGVTVVAVAGFAASEGFFAATPIFWAVASGAFLGDIGGYWLGHKGKHHFRPDRALLNERHLTRAKAFFAAHGGKSVLLGRFTGVLRATIPFVAGASSMPIGAFLFWNALSALLWTGAWLTVGRLSGGAIHSIWDALRSIL